MRRTPVHATDTSCGKHHKLRNKAQQATCKPAWRTVLTVNARVADRELHGGGARGNRRRTDFETLQAALSADSVDWDAVDSNKIWRALHRGFGFAPVAAAQVFLRRNRYEAVWCFTEVEGLLLAFLFKLFRIRRALFMIGIETLSPKVIFLLRWLRVWTHFTAILPTSTHQAAELRRRTSIPDNKVIVLPYQVDCRYFSREPNSAEKARERYIVAAGLESRDYPTLIEAVADLDVQLIIAAASHWSGRGSPITGVAPKITVGSYTYSELRRIYAGAALAVVPLHESPYQHGITALQEAMAMGLPVIVTRTTGQSDVVIDRRKALRSNPELQTQGGFARALAPDRLDLQESNGLYVGVGDVATLRRTIHYLLEQRDVALQLGMQAQLFAREMLSVELFVERAVRLVKAAREGDVIYPNILSGTYVRQGSSSNAQ